MAKPHSRPFAPETFAAGAQAWPDLHPAQAAMRALAAPKGPRLGSVELRARRDAELRFFGITEARRARFPALDVLAQGVHRRWDPRIDDAERREAREAQLDRIETTLAEAQARLERAAART